MAASSDRAEQRPQQQEVVVRLLGTHRQLHGTVDDRVKVRLKKYVRHVKVTLKQDGQHENEGEAGTRWPT